MKASAVHSHRRARDFKPIALTVDQITDAALNDLRMVGINVPPHIVHQMVSHLGVDTGDNAVALDSLTINPLAPLTTPSAITPVQFLQAFLPGFVRVISAARKIDEIIGRSTIGSWEDEEIVLGVMEPAGAAEYYTDYGNIPLMSYNVNWERRTVVRFEAGLSVGNLEEARAARARVSAAAEKRTSSSLSLEISRNRVGFFGFNSGNNRTYGFLNDPNLPAYQSLPTGGWATATFQQITGDLRFLAARLQTTTQDTIDPAKGPITLALATTSAQYLSVTTDFGMSVRDWITKTYPNWRIVSAPELNAANGGANVVYLFADEVDDGATDDSRTFIQVVPATFQALGVEKRAKSYLEDYTNATAGTLLKRPYAVVRGTGS